MIRKFAQNIWVEKTFGICGIYIIVHAPSGATYVGSSVSCGRRWAEHITNLNRGRHNKDMLALWASSVPEEWLFQIFKALPNGSDDALLLKEEQDAWAQLNGLGIKLLCGRPKNRGNTHKQVVKEKIPRPKRKKNSTLPDSQLPAGVVVGPSIV